MIAGNALGDAIDRAYPAFARYGFPHKLEAAPTRDGAAILRTLGSAPLRELCGEALGPYAGYAMTTVGGVGDYKHFLPRILELAILEPIWLGTTPRVVAEKIVYGQWRAWPDREREAVLAVFDAAWMQARNEHPEAVNALDWLEGCVTLGLDATALLEAWLPSLNADGALQLASLVHRESQPPDPPAKPLPARPWLASDAVAEALRRFAGSVAPEDEWLLQAGLKAHAALDS